LLLPLVLAARDFLANVVMSRGQGQNAFTIVDVLNAAGFIAAPVAFAMIMSSRLQRKLRLLSVVDAVMGGGLILLLGLNGRRGAALAVIVVVLVFATRRKGANLRALFGLAGAAFFAYVVVTYRTAAAGGRTTLSTSAVLLRDLGSVAYTTGGTDRVIHGDYLGGQTLIAGLVRQLPSPIANQLLGPPVDTGTFIFRQITGLTNASQGYGFSIPAEGVLNFGVAGTLIHPFAAGAGLAWLYGRFDVTGSRTIALIYPLAVGSVPFAWRSDLLGAVKGVLYPALVLWAVIVVARTISSTNARLGKGSERQIAPHPTSHPTAAPRRPTCGAEGTRATR
jgi:hypothetical protein